MMEYFLVVLVVICVLLALCSSSPEVIRSADPPHGDRSLGTVLLLILAAIVLAWGGFIAGRSHRELSIQKCAKGFGECMTLMEMCGSKLDECRLKLPAERRP
jgi:protein-S-isoprenylcysteine O-methyltransferase Ste14